MEKKFHIVVHTDTNHYSYDCTSEFQKNKIVKREKDKSEVLDIYVNYKRIYYRDE